MDPLGKFHYSSRKNPLGKNMTARSAADSGERAVDKARSATRLAVDGGAGVWSSCEARNATE